MVQSWDRSGFRERQTAVTDLDPSRVRRLELAAAALGVCVGLIAIVTLVGWGLSLHRLTRWVAIGQPMKVNTALCLVAVAAALTIATWRPGPIMRRTSQVLSAFTVLLAGLTLFERLTHIDLRIDQLLVHDTFSDTVPGRMSIATACILIWLGLAVGLIDVATRASQGFAAIGMAGAMLSLLSFAYDVRSLTEVGAFSSMAVHTAACMALVSLGVLLASPRRDPTGFLASNYVGGQLTRTVMPFVLTMPPIVGLVRLWGQKRGLYGTEFGIALFAITNVVIIAAVVLWTARMLDRSDHRRRLLEADREDLLQRERAARERAEAASRSKDALLSMVSHELRTPLTPALMLVRSMENDPALPPALREDVATIREQIYVEVRIINDLLDMANLSDAGFSLRRETVSLRPLVQQGVAAITSAAREAGVTVALDLPPHELTVHGDPSRLTQILRNLLDNAVKFSPRGGEVAVRAEQVEQLIRIEVTDSGVGIPADAIDRVFEAFEQADSSTTRRFGGMGMGLTIARKLAVAHGGSLDARSAGPGKGATFTLTLPVYEQPAIAPGQIEMKPAPAAQLSLLIVEDNTQTLKMMSRLLGARGYAVTTAESATSALRAAIDTSFDVVVSDIGLPDMNGWELFDALRRIRPLCGIAVSGFVTEEDRERSAEVGFHAHLDKPLDIDRLDQQIRAAAESRCAQT